MKRFIMLMSVVALIATPVFSQVIISRDLDEATILALTTDTDSDPRGMAVTADGSVRYFFEDETSVPGPGEDSLLSWNGTTLAVHVSEAQFETVTGTGATLDDLCIDSAGTLYAIVRSDAGDEFVVRIPSAGTVQNMVSHIIGAPGASCIDVDETTNRLIIAFTSAFGAPANDLWYVPTTATAASATLFSSEANMAGALTPGGASMGIGDIVVQSTGAVIVYNGFGSGDDDGDLVRVTSPIAATPFADRLTLLAAMGEVAGTMGDGFLECNSNDGIIFWQNGGTDPPGEDLIIGSADGTTWSSLATEAQILADDDFSGTDVGNSGNGLAMNAANGLFMSMTGAGDEGIVVFSGAGLAVPVELSVFTLD